MIKSTCPACGFALDFSAWDLLAGANFPAFSRCQRCLRRVHLPHWWHAITLLTVMILAVAAPFVRGVEGLLPGLVIFMAVYASLSIGLNALYIALGGRLVAEDFR